MSTTKTHPLENNWTLWYDSKRTATKKEPKKEEAGKKEQQTADSWEDNLVQVDTVNSVEGFWVMLNQIKKPSNLELGANYHLFKKGIKPMWEDPANSKGGKWVITLQTKEDLYRVDNIWEELLMAMIGEYLEEVGSGDQVVGAVLSRRRNAFRVSVWTRDNSAKESLEALGPRCTDLMKVDASKVALVYLAHNQPSGDK
jgi:translation initiation factor 4E